MVNEERVEKAVHYLIESAEEYARAKSEAKSLAYTLKSAEAQAFLEAEGPVREKEMKARASERYAEALDKYKTAEYNAELLDARRESAKILISYYQSVTRAKTVGY